MASFAGRPPRSDGDYEQIALRHPDDHSPNTAAFIAGGHGHEPVASTTRPADSLSLHSNTPLAPQQQRYQSMPQRPPLPQGTVSQGSESPTVENVGYGHGKPYAGGADSTRPNSSWDLLAGIRKFEHEYSEFDSRHANEPHLRFADGDVPKNKVRLGLLALFSRMRVADHYTRIRRCPGCIIIS